MKSKLISLKDYKEVEFEKTQKIVFEKEVLERALHRISRKYKKKEKVEFVEKGDVLFLKLESDVPKFNKKGTMVTVGGNLFDEGFEKMLLGHKVGEKFEVEVLTKDETQKVRKTAVKVEILQGQRTIFPQATDEMVKDIAKTDENFKGLETLKEYERKIKDEFYQSEKQNVLYTILKEVLDKVIEDSTFKLDEEELKELYELRFQETKEILEEEENVKYDELTSQQLEDFWEVSTFEEVEELFHQEIEYEVSFLLCILAINGGNSQDYDLFAEEEEDVDVDLLDTKDVFEYIEDKVNFVFL